MKKDWRFATQVGLMAASNYEMNTLITDDLLFTGSLFFLKDKKRHNLGVLFRDAIIEYITEQKGKPMDATVEGRVTIR